MIKKITITFVRHGTTVYNEQDRVQGSSDIPLSDKGKSEIDNIIVTNNYDYYYHSPLSRSKDTLLGIMNKNDLPLSNIIESALITERGYGIFEGLTKEEISIKYPDLYNEWNINENIKGSRIETIENVIYRIREFISRIVSFNINNILAVTHSGFLCALFKYITNSPLSLKPQQLEVQFPNCCVVQLNVYIFIRKYILVLLINDKEFIKVVNF